MHSALSAQQPMQKKAIQDPEVFCPYCNKHAVLVDSECVYAQSYGLIWLCTPCLAWVGVHKGTHRPLGRLANKELRQWKQRAHAAFDPLWQEKWKRRCAGGMGKSGKPGGTHYKKAYARMSGYKWLAEAMDIDRKDCHIGMFDIEQCQQVIQICSKYYRQPERTLQ